MDSPLLVTHVRRWSDSYVLILPRAIREHLGLVAGDVVGLRKVGRLVMMKRIVPGEVMPLTEEEARDAANSRRAESGRREQPDTA
jgi:antitoxin component of MazEF toxin-antitoxin module